MSDLNQIKEKILRRLDNVEMELKTQQPIPEPGLKEWYDALTWVVSLFSQPTLIPISQPTPNIQTISTPRQQFPLKSGVYHQPISLTPQNYPLTQNSTVEDWMNHLPQQGEDVFIPGEITVQRPKAIAFQIRGKNQIWIPNSVVNTVLSNVKGIYVRQWWLKKNLDKVGE